MQIYGVVVFKLIGRLDSVTVANVGKQMLKYIDDGDSSVVMDLSELEYISSAGLQTILRITRKIKAADGKFVLAALSSDVLAVIEFAGFNTFLSIFDTVDLAVDSF